MALLLSYVETWHGFTETMSRVPPYWDPRPAGPQQDAAVHSLLVAVVRGAHLKRGRRACASTARPLMLIHPVYLLVHPVGSCRRDFEVRPGSRAPEFLARGAEVLEAAFAAGRQRCGVAHTTQHAGGPDPNYHLGGLLHHTDCCGIYEVGAGRPALLRVAACVQAGHPSDTAHSDGLHDEGFRQRQACCRWVGLMNGIVLLNTGSSTCCWPV
jgi:hypothetical protein